MTTTATHNPTLSHTQASRVYDRIGRLQDTQAWYEDRAVREVTAHAAFERAHAVVELGAGTGRHARRLLAEHLPGDASYLGLDVSPRMVALATERLRPWHPRATVRLTDGAPVLELPDASVDRFFSTYVFDLLAEADIRAVLDEAHRVLAPGGKLCLVSAAPGQTRPQRAVMGLVARLHAWRPALVGGCRPLDLLPLLEASHRWRIDYARTVSLCGICSQVVVATPHAA